MLHRAPKRSQSGIPLPAVCSRIGFSFVETLFAIMIVAIGFVMVACMLTVGVQQTADNADHSSAVLAGRAASAKLARMPNYISMATPNSFYARPSMPCTVFGTTTRTAIDSLIPGVVVSFHDARILNHVPPGFGSPVPNLSQRVWNNVAGDLILPSDPRFAWVGFYRRDASGLSGSGGAPSGAQFVQLIAVVVRNHNRSRYDVADLARVGTYPATLEPVLAQATITRGDPSVVQFTFDRPEDLGRLAQNGFVIISDDNASGVMNGRILRLGNARSTSAGAPDTWELMPGFDLAPTEPRTLNALVFVIGRGYADPTHPELAFDGPAQDVAAYVDFLPSVDLYEGQ